MLQVAEDVGEVALEDAAHAGDGGHVLLLALQSCAGGSAEAHLVFQAGSPHLDCSAGAEGEELPDDVLQLAEDAAVGVRAVEAFGFWFLAFGIMVRVAGEDESGIVLVGEAEVGVGLVVLEETVVAGLVALDEVVLEEEGVDLGGHDGDTDVVDVADEHANLGALVVVAGEVLADALLEVAGLADIDDLARGVEVLVHTRTLGDGLEPQGDAVDVGVDGTVDHLGSSSCAFRMVKPTLRMPASS